jgi:hypothetical protein
MCRSHLAVLNRMESRAVRPVLRFKDESPLNAPQSSSASRFTAAQAGFLLLDPIRRAAGAVGGALALRHDAFESPSCRRGRIRSGPSASMCSLRRRPGAALAKTEARIALRPQAAPGEDHHRLTQSGRSRRGTRCCHGADIGCGRKSAFRHRRRRPPRRR